MTPLRRQLPVHSPLSLGAVMSAVGGGDERAEIAARLADTYGVASALLTDSGTSALSLALRAAAERRPGLPCALPGYGCYDLATAALGARVGVALYDVDPETFAPRVESLEPILRAGCAAVVVVHHYGVPAPLAALRAMLTAADALLIEDAAQAAGTVVGSGPAGSQGDLAILSFGRGKGITAGHGGALLVPARSSALMRERLRTPLPDPTGDVAFSLKLGAQWLLARPSVYGVPARLPFLGLGETVFREPTEPQGLPTRAARVLRHSLDAAEAEAIVRWRHADRLRARQQLAAPASMVRVERDARPGWLRLPVLARDAEGAPASARADAAALGVMPGYPLPLRDLAPLRAYLVNSDDPPGARSLSRRLWTLPTHSRLTERDLVQLERWIAALA